MDLRPQHGLSLCAGGGGLDMGLMLAEPGFETRCWVEWEEYPRQTIIAAQRAGYFAAAPIWDDLRTFDARLFRGAFDTVLAGYPCQPFSSAGKRLGEDDERHLWPHVARIIREVEPRWVFLENVAGHVSLGAETVLRDLWGLGYTPAAGLFSASEVGARHERLRWFCVAYRDHGMRTLQSERSERDQWGRSCDEGDGMADADGRDAGAEREQRSGEQRLHEASGRIGGADMGDAESIRWRQGRPEPEIWIWQHTSARADGEMAYPYGAERQGQQRGQRHKGGRQEPNGYSALCSRAGLFPPGPSDAASWAETLSAAPDLAPAASLRDCLAWARDLATADAGPGQAAAEPAVRRMAHGLAARARALRLLGNGVVPLAAAHAWRSLAAAHGLRPVDLDTADE